MLHQRQGRHATNIGDCGLMFVQILEMTLLDIAGSGSRLSSVWQLVLASPISGIVHNCFVGGVGGKVVAGCEIVQQYYILEGHGLLGRPLSFARASSEDLHCGL